VIRRAEDHQRKVVRLYTSLKGGASVFEILRAEVPLERLLKMNGHHKALCVAHDDKTPSMHVYEDHVHCFACGFHGDVVDVHRVRRGLERPIEAAFDLAREYAVRLPEMSEEGRQAAEARRTREDELLDLAKTCLGYLKDHPASREWWEGRGFDAQVRERFLLGTTEDGKWATIPFWTRGARIAGTVRRIIKEAEGVPKYKLPKAENFPGGYRPLFIPAPISSEAFMVEGYIDGLAIAAMGKPVIVVGGTGISEGQSAELRRLDVERITILPDNDGEEGAAAARNWGRRFFPAARVAPADYAGEKHKDIADLFAASGPEATLEHLDRLTVAAEDLVDVEMAACAELEGGPREKLAYAAENIVPLLARIQPAGIQDATADIVADRVDGLKKNWLTRTIKDEMERLTAESFKRSMLLAEQEAAERRAEYEAKVAAAQEDIDALFVPGVLERLRNAASQVHHVERDERALEMALLVALGAQLAPLPNGRPSGASALLTADAGRGKNHVADAAVELLPEEFYEAFEIVSAQAFYYAVENDPDFLRHTFVYPNEIEGVEALVEFLRPMLSKGWCKKHVTDKDPITGRNTMRTMIVEGPVTTIIPTIRNKTDDQLQTRLLMAELEDYLGRVKIHSKAVSDLYHPDHARADFTRERFLWAEGLRQLTAVRRVVFRIAHEDFAYDDDKVSHGARLWANLLGLMSAHAWLEQRNRRILDLGEDEQAIEATPDDYEAAFNVFTEVCRRTTVNLSETHRKILNGIHLCMQEDSLRDGFTTREIADKGGISHQAVSKHKTYLVSSAKLIHDGVDGLILNVGVTESDWQLGDFSKGLPSPEQVREWWDPDGPDDGRGQGRGQRGQAT
jgi:DNA primase